MPCKNINFNLGKVVSRIDWTESLFTIRIRSGSIPYISGQFTKLALYDKNKEFHRRAYSIVNSPENHKKTVELEFLIITDPKGNLSPLIHQLNVNDYIYVGTEGTGFMTLDAVPTRSKDLWLLSTGTAIGPFISMLEDENENKRFNNIILVHAVRKKSELAYKDKIKQLELKYQGKLKYVRIISREQTPRNLSGRIPELLRTGELERECKVLLCQTSSFLYMCGNPQMVKDTSDTLKSLGFSKHLQAKSGQFSSENYWKVG